MPPAVLLNSLQGVRRKVKTFSLIYGIGIVLACSVSVIMATVFLDWALDLPAAPRLRLATRASGPADLSQDASKETLTTRSTLGARRSRSNTKAVIVSLVHV